MSIRILYSCHLCGLHRVGTDVTERGQEQDVVDWVKNVMTPEVCRDHDRRSPDCRDHDRRSPDCHPKTITEIMIPISGTDKIGEAAKN